MSSIKIPEASLARLRAQYGAFQQTAQTIVEAMGYGEAQGANLNLEAGVLELPGGTPNEALTPHPNGVSEPDPDIPQHVRGAA
jgi:hypothetical protein